MFPGLHINTLTAYCNLPICEKYLSYVCVLAVSNIWSHTYIWLFTKITVGKLHCGTSRNEYVGMEKNFTQILKCDWSVYLSMRAKIKET